VSYAELEQRLLRAIDALQKAKGEKREDYHTLMLFRLFVEVSAASELVKEFLMQVDPHDRLNKLLDTSVLATGTVPSEDELLAFIRREL
jgi:hypothetical protein